MAASISHRLQIVCLVPETGDPELKRQAEQQKIKLLSMRKGERQLRRALQEFVFALSRQSHVGWRNRPLPFSDRQSQSVLGCGDSANELPDAAEWPVPFQIRARQQWNLPAAGNRALYGSLEGEAAVVEIFRWRRLVLFRRRNYQPDPNGGSLWAHLLIDNLQKLDETLELVSVGET
jgi:hypothetical protein